MVTEAPAAKLERALDDFDPTVRAQALAVLASLAERGEIPLAPTTPVANMHCHTFFGFNAYGHSPSSIAWHAKRRGYQLMGKLDFDVLDGVDEFLAACELVRLRGTAGVETRVFIPEFADREINSPGEPGIAYHMGIGFTSGQVLEKGARLLADIRQRAARRNRGLIERVNAYLDPVTIDYQTDVLPLTPMGNVTERHIVLAYIQVAERIVADPLAFWADRLGVSRDRMVSIADDPATLRRRIRARLFKQGGIGYVPPGRNTFPLVGEFNEMVVACGAIPCAGWLDGASEGEQSVKELLELHISKGAAALNVIPEYARARPQDLVRVVRLAEEMALPLNVGTEMNSLGQPMMDDFEAPVFDTVRQQFLDGAHFVYGHTVMQRALGLGYQSEWAGSHLPSRHGRNDFYTKVGYCIPPGRAGTVRLKQLDPTMSPADMLSKIGLLG